MPHPTDYFTDLLLAGEGIVAAIGGPGPALERRVGQERTWWQLAFTPSRLLVVRLTQAPMSSAWQPAQRYAVGKSSVRMARYPRTPQSPARLEIGGAAEPISLHDIDDPAIFPQVEPFVAAFGRPLEGAGLIHVHAVDPEEEVASDTRKLLVVLALCLVMVMLCCGCSGAIWGLRWLLAGA